jgi:hypothetical protein
MTQDTGADSRIPDQVDGKRVVSAFRLMASTTSLRYRYLVITDEGARGDDDVYTVGTAVYYHPGAVAEGGAWRITETYGAHMPASEAARQFAQAAFGAANAARAAGPDAWGVL